MDTPQIFSLSQGLLFLLFFALSLCLDFKQQKIPLFIFIFFFALKLLHILFFWNIYLSIYSTLTTIDFFLYLSPAVFALFLLYLAKWSKEAIGYGDGLFLLLSSLYCNFYHFFFLLFSAFFCACFVSITLFCYCKRKKKNPKHCRFPFLPCFLPGMFYLFSISLLK